MLCTAFPAVRSFFRKKGILCTENGYFVTSPLILDENSIIFEKNSKKGLIFPK